MEPAEAFVSVGVYGHDLLGLATKAPTESRFSP
jgi:hypothetical protein